MAAKKIKVLDQVQIDQKINRIAYQIYENNCEEKELIIAGISDRGFVLAGLIAKKLQEISDLDIALEELHIDKKAPMDKGVKFSIAEKDFKNKIVILVDDVLNSGKTLIYGTKHFLSVPLKKLSTVVLVDRNHKRFPISGDYVGLSIATTMQEHITVDFKKGKSSVYLS